MDEALLISSSTAESWVRKQLDRIEPHEEPIKDQFLEATQLAAGLKPDRSDPILDPEEFALLKTVFERRPRFFYWSDIKEEVGRTHRSLTLIQKILRELPPGFEETEKRELLSLLSRASTTEKDPYNEWQPPAIDWFLATLRQYRRINSPQKRFLDYLAPLREKKEIRSSDFVLIYKQVKDDALPHLKTKTLTMGREFVPLKISAFHQVAVQGQTIPLRVQISPATSHERLMRPLDPVKWDGLEVEFYRQDLQTGRNVLLGVGITDAHGIATIYHKAEENRSFHLVYNIKNDPRDFRQSHGQLEVLSTKKPVIAVDLDGLRQEHFFWSGVTQSLQKLIAAGYQPVAIVHRGASSEHYAKMVTTLKPLKIPVLYNDFSDGTFDPDEKGFDETQLEKLKRLKFESGLPVVGVLTRELDQTASYQEAQIEIIPFEDDLASHEKALTQNHRDFLTRIESPDFDPEIFYWDGMTESRWREENEIQLLPGNEEAANALKRIIRGARSFISFQGVTLIDDPFGNEIRDLLIQKAKGEEGSPPIPVRLILDGALGNFIFPTASGIGRTNTDDIERLEKNGVEVTEHELYEYFDWNETFLGVMTRLHAKFLIADTPDGIVAMGGGRHPSTSYFGTKTDKREFNWFEKLTFSIDLGPYQDLSYTIRGPVVQDIHRELIERFEYYKERRLEEAEKKRLLDPQLYRPRPESIRNTPARLILHRPYQNQNCQNVLTRFLESPAYREVTLVNSFEPTDALKEAMKKAAREGKQVRWIVGKLGRFYDDRRDKVFQELLDAGVEIYQIPYKLHTKLYGTHRYYAFGNHNIDTFSLRDVEDLLMIPVNSDGGRQAREYVEKLLSGAKRLHKR